MGRKRENPRYNVISMRISDAELDSLQEIIETTDLCVSDILRQALGLFKAKLTEAAGDGRQAA